MQGRIRAALECAEADLRTIEQFAAMAEQRELAWTVAGQSAHGRHWAALRQRFDEMRAAFDASLAGLRELERRIGETGGHPR